MAVCNNASRRLSIYSKTSRTDKITKSCTLYHTIKKRHTTVSKHSRLRPRSNASTCQKNSSCTFYPTSECDKLFQDILWPNRRLQNRNISQTRRSTLAL